MHLPSSSPVLNSAILMRKMFLILLALLNAVVFFGQKEKLNRVVAGFPVNYEDSLAGTYTLPDLFTLQNGKKVTNAASWMNKRRPEIVKLFEENQFGKMPGRPAAMRFHVFDNGTPVLNGKAIRKQVTIYFTGDTSKYKMDVLIYLPANSVKPPPLLLLANFYANANAVNDPGVKQTDVWTREGKKIPASQMPSFTKMNVDDFITAGIGVATIYYGDIEPDFKTGFLYGIRGKYLKPGETYPASDE